MRNRRPTAVKDGLASRTISRMTADGIRAAIEAATGHYAAHPEQARSTDSEARASLVNGLVIEVEGPGGEHLTTDMVRSVGGTGTAPSPGWLLRAAEASCVTTLIAMRAAVLGITLETVEVTVDSESDDRGMLGMDDAVPSGPLSGRVAGAPHRRWRRGHHARGARALGRRSLPRVQRPRAPGPDHRRGCDELDVTRSRNDAHYQSARRRAGPRDLRGLRGDLLHRVRDRLPDRSLVPGAIARCAGGTDGRPRRLDPCAAGVPARDHDGHGIRSLRHATRPSCSTRRIRSARRTSARVTCPNRLRARSASCCANTCRSVSRHGVRRHPGRHQAVRRVALQLWTIAEAVAKATSRATCGSTFVESAQRDHRPARESNRLTASNSRVPETVLLLLFVGSVADAWRCRLQRRSDETARAC